MAPLDLINLTALMKRTSGRPEIKIGLIDGPVLPHHPDLSIEHVREISVRHGMACTQAKSVACLHGTFVAGILSAKRNSPAPAICPDCTLLVRPIFPEGTSGIERMPTTTPAELATAILDCLDAGVRVINLSLALAQPSRKGEQALEEALNQSAKRGVLVVAAAGNQGTLGSSTITRHPWVIPVVGCDFQGRPLNESNMSSSIGRHGLSAPGAGITSLGTEGRPLTLGGTSVAVPFVTGAIALLWSEIPSMSAAQIKLALMQTPTRRRTSVVPPLMDAAAADQFLWVNNVRRRA
ncbi:MAG TPA: S8/S53 family peptidase [Nitrospira sp.]|nr:S8/S53 family peptidase [Nitrospira sp.]